MTPRENLLSLLRRKGYETVPVLFELCPNLLQQLQSAAATKGWAGPAVEDYCSGNLFPVDNTPQPVFADRGEIDWRAFYPGEIKSDTYFDEDYGIGHEHGSESAWHMTRMLHPMEHFDSIEQMQAYPWPDWSCADVIAAKKIVAETHSRGRAAKGFMQMTIWETAWYLRGMENLMADMMDEDPMAEYLLDMVTERAYQKARYFALADTDVIFLGDDLGMQSTLLMSPELYRTWIRPRLRQVVDAAKSVKPDIVIDYHTCGYIKPLIPDLMEAGVEVLNPVQPECMDFAEIYGEYGQSLSFRGTIGTQTTMPFGTPKEVKREVWKNLDIAGAQGGLFVMPTHTLEPEVPLENVAAYIDTCREYTEC